MKTIIDLVNEYHSMQSVEYVPPSSEELAERKRLLEKQFLDLKKQKNEN